MNNPISTLIDWVDIDKALRWNTIATNALLGESSEFSFQDFLNNRETYKYIAYRYDIRKDIFDALNDRANKFIEEMLVSGDSREETKS